MSTTPRHTRCSFALVCGRSLPRPMGSLRFRRYHGITVWDGGYVPVRQGVSAQLISSHLQLIWPHVVSCRLRLPVLTTRQSHLVLARKGALGLKVSNLGHASWRILDCAGSASEVLQWWRPLRGGRDAGVSHQMSWQLPRDQAAEHTQSAVHTRTRRFCRERETERDSRVFSLLRRAACAEQRE